MGNNPDKGDTKNKKRANSYEAYEAYMILISKTIDRKTRSKLLLAVLFFLVAIRLRNIGFSSNQNSKITR